MPILLSAALKYCWTDVLFNQFHGILGGAYWGYIEAECLSM